MSRTVLWARRSITNTALHFAAFVSIWPIQSRAADSSADAANPDPVVLVTAQKRTQREQEIPMSLTAISGDDIERAGARDFNDLLLSIPGVSYAGTELGQSHFSIRGVSTSAANPTVGIYMDDVPLVTIATAFSGALQPMLVDIDRVEVLKGPQGTLYGGSAMGGAIKYVTRKPLLDQFSIRASGEVASVDHGGVSYGGESFINLPLIDDHLALRFGGAYRFDSGYIDNIRNGEVQVWTESATSPPTPFAPVTYPSQSQFTRDDYNSRGTTVARASMLYESGGSWSLLPTATIQRSEKPNPDEFFTNLPKFENTNRFNQPLHDDFDIYSFQVTKSFAGITVTSLTGYFDRDLRLNNDFSLYIGIVVPELLSQNSYNFSTTSTKTFSQEIRAASALADAPLKWTAGVYYSRQRDYYDQAIDTLGAGNFFGDGTDITFATDTLTHTYQEAAFGDLTYSVDPAWDLSAGLRWFDIRQRIDGAGNGVFNGGRTEVNARRSTNVGVTPKLSVAYHVSDAHMVYASAAKGFRAGGPNALGTNSPECGPSLQQLGLEHTPESYQSDSLWSYEIGTKNELTERHGVLDVAVFYTDWKKIQQSIILASCAMQFVGNVGAAKVQGAEISAKFPLPGNFLVGGAVTYTQTKVTRSAAGVSAQPGEELLHTPKSMDSLYVQYQFNLHADTSGGVRAEYQYHGANLRQFQPTQEVSYPDGTTGAIPDATQVQAAYHVVNASAYWSHAQTRYRLFVDNVTDAAPYLDFRRVPGFSAATTLRPRTIGIGIDTMF